MRLGNELSIPRALYLFERKWFRATCLSSDQVGRCVYVTGPPVAGIWPVATCSPTEITKMPAVGVIIEKFTSTTCRVQKFGELNGLYSGLTRNRAMVVGLDGSLVDGTGLPVPPAGGYFVQWMGTATASDSVLLRPSDMMTRRIG